MCLHSNVIIGMNAVKVGEKRRDGRRRPRPHAQTAGSGRERARANPCRPACAQAHGSRRPGGRQTAAVAQPAVPCRRACTGGRRQGRARASGSRSCARIGRTLPTCARAHRPTPDLRARASTDPWPTCARLGSVPTRARIRQSVVRAHRPNPADVRARLPSPADARARLAEPCRRLAEPDAARAWRALRRARDARARLAEPCRRRARLAYHCRRARARLAEPCRRAGVSLAGHCRCARASLAGNCRRARASLADHCRRARAWADGRARDWTTPADARAPGRPLPMRAREPGRALPTCARASLADHCRRPRAPGPMGARETGPLPTCNPPARARLADHCRCARASLAGHCRRARARLGRRARASLADHCRRPRALGRWARARLCRRAGRPCRRARAAGPTDALETGRPQATCARSWADGRARGWPTPAEVLAQLGRRARARLADPCRRARAPGRPLPTRARAWPTTADARASLAGHCRRARASLADHCRRPRAPGPMGARETGRPLPTCARAPGRPLPTCARAPGRPLPTAAREPGRPQPTCAHPSRRARAAGPTGAREAGRPLPTCGAPGPSGARDWPTSADVRARAWPTPADVRARTRQTAGDVRPTSSSPQVICSRRAVRAHEVQRHRATARDDVRGARKATVMDGGRGPWCSARSRSGHGRRSWAQQGNGHGRRAPRPGATDGRIADGGSGARVGLSMSHARHHLFYAAVGLARPLCRLQYPVAYLSRLQRILPAARWELYFKAANAARPPRGLGQRHVPLGARGPLLRVGKRTAGVRVASSPDSDLEAFSHNPAHGRADIEGSKSNVAMNAWLPQAVIPVVTFLTPLASNSEDVPPQPNSPPDNVFRRIGPPRRALGPKRGAVPRLRFTE
ncbi:UNVERIFIED_CONTAM: hypothetical protein Slati_4592200 [Sesamum latifolium]|uniref:Uncharacterized protein n=1 Tax=Sesamum latifolium TaxID=2727402 RepID=A0AAW2S4P3_9LAMI